MREGAYYCGCRKDHLRDMLMEGQQLQAYRTSTAYWTNVPALLSLVSKCQHDAYLRQETTSKQVLWLVEYARGFVE